jgi:hypothetical protein
MKILIIILLLSFSTYSHTDVFNTVIENNQNQIIGGILDDKVDEDLLKLLIDTIELQNSIDETTSTTDSNCSDKREDNQGNGRRRVVKSKTIESNGYELVFLAEATSYKIPHESDLIFTSSANTAQVNELYALMSNADSEDEMYQILDQYLLDSGIKELTLKEQALFAAALANKLPYSDPRAEFKQDFNQGSVSLFTMITTDNDDLSGICGDLHAAHNDLMKRINPVLEAYTMSYATDYSQHVISYVVDPEDPDKVIMTNYSRVEIKDADGVANLAPVNTSMDDVGERIRFFQYKDGRQDHVGTFRNDIGSLLYELSTADFERGATPNDQRYGLQQIQNKWSKVVTKYKEIEKANGETKEKSKTFVINNDLIMFRGTTAQGNEMVGILHKRQRLRNVDANGELLPGETYGSHSFMSTAVGHVDYDRESSAFGGNNWYDHTKYFKVYFVTGKRYIKRIVEKKGFVFDGFIGHQLEAGLTMDISPTTNSIDSPNGFNFNTADGDYSIDLGFKMKAELGENNVLGFNTMLSNHIGLDDERAIYSFTTDYPQNLQMTPNALQSNLYLETFTGAGVIRNTASYTGTQMGGKAGYRFDFLPNGGGNLYVSFSTPVQGISSNKINVLPENYTVVRAGFASPDLLPKKKADLQINTRFDYAPGQWNPVNLTGGIKLQF